MIDQFDRIAEEASLGLQKEVICNPIDQIAEEANLQSNQIDRSIRRCKKRHRLITIHIQFQVFVRRQIAEEADLAIQSDRSIDRSIRLCKKRHRLITIYNSKCLCICTYIYIYMYTLLFTHTHARKSEPSRTVFSGSF